MANALGTLALQMGFASRELAYVQQEVWDVKRMWDKNAMKRKDVVDIMEKLDDVLIGLRGYLSDFQVEEFGNIRTRIIGRHVIATKYLAKMFGDAVAQTPTYEEAKALFIKSVTNDMAVDGWKTWQKEDWTTIRNSVLAVIRDDQRLMAWFQIGDRSAKAVYDIFPLESPPKDYDLTQIYAPMNLLRGEERRAVEGLIPNKKHSGSSDLVNKVRTTFRALCKLLDEHESDLLAVPQWDGSDLVFRGKRVFIQAQASSARSLILRMSGGL